MQGFSDIGKIILAHSGGGLRVLLLPLAAWTNSKLTVKWCCFIQQPLQFESIFRNGLCHTKT